MKNPEPLNGDEGGLRTVVRGVLIGVLVVGSCALWAYGTAAIDWLQNRRDFDQSLWFSDREQRYYMTDDVEAFLETKPTRREVDARLGPPSERECWYLGGPGIEPKVLHVTYDHEDRVKRHWIGSL